MKLRRRLEARLDRLDTPDDASPPRLFTAWGVDADLDAEAVVTEWARVVRNTPADRDPFGTAWRWSLESRLFVE